MRYYTDKNGKPLNEARGYVIRDAKGELFELYGTGTTMPGDNPMVVTLWSEDNKIVSRLSSEIELVGPEYWPLLVGVVITGVLLLLAAFTEGVKA